MKKQVCSSLLTLSMTASILSPAAMAAEISVPDDNQNAIAAVSDTGSSSANNDITVNWGELEEGTLGDIESGTLDLSGNSENSDEEDESEESGPYSYEVDEETNEVCITKYNSATDTGAAIPSEIDGKPVTSIGANAFSGCDKLTWVSIPKSVKSIGEGAFQDCGLLKTVYYGGANPWDWKTVTKGENNTPLDEAVKKYKSLRSGDYLYQTDDNNQVSIKGYVGEDTNLEIPGTLEGKTVISIGSDAFKDMNTLESVTIPDSVTSIGAYALRDCSSLTSVEIPESVTSIGDYAFKGCSKLKSITIPNKVTSIADDTFNGCTSLTSINLSTALTSIGAGAFEGCSNLTAINIPTTVASIGARAFQN